MGGLLLAVTPGDPDGIGPEIVWKTLKARKLPAGVQLLCVGAQEPFKRLGAPVELVSTAEPLVPPRRRGPFVWLLPAPETSPRRGLGALPGFQSGWSIATATQLVLQGRAAALVTGPISKERLQAGGFRYPGHTEFLAKLCGVPEVTMMLANETLRISLVTTHLALKDVPRALTRLKIERAVQDTAWHLRHWWGLRRPRIAVAALNPHAGEGGIFGKEELRVIEPTLRALRRNRALEAELLGPLPADTLFANHLLAKPAQRYDAVVCMYHDQGLIPVKLVDFHRTVNVTLGLPIIRTSVDHGTGFDIAWKNKADPSSFQSAVALAARLARTRAKAGRPERNVSPA